VGKSSWKNGRSPSPRQSRYSCGSLRGICGSELEAYAGITDKRRPPLVFGHELAVELVDDPGEALYAVNPLTTCGGCVACKSNHANRCVDRRLLSMHSDGGDSEYLAVDRASLHRMTGCYRPCHRRSCRARGHRGERPR
jgi:D-arabinose 1-dehydrogenase-like Zn-dependent alcohol dehydrogenase